ncbi:MAG: hypothetical protein A2275_14915 [Bacteroidetes bacterium RIFOXYA12_FULL_35_11]|nr:MAG: hypothetical protein A2X01_10060 [Bacteroidetes bacterium GWF2_35_48]OFY73299.1 MAG: hypothetical protein A2275_14915 [Bacteroidetes bacterium RIFOXYA12_FULL_35_11]OFY97134.1 MAG: hypothetical protein A2309_13785 [Bacteroidetes bacterium RIFOXYB2_FULL_35_7]OFY97988.1 MAG: hypothetical protein A2491_19085 [Bacteroidetes bacterium RIFOXYC12_FULL_35_7]HBX52364.1 hypothetical protein [Bacteroidales bacterium]
MSKKDNSTLKGFHLDDNFLQRTNMDLFGNDNEQYLHWGKIFLQMFREFYSIYRINHDINSEALLKEMIIKYNLKESQIIRIERANREKFSEPDFHEHTEYLLMIKEGFFVAFHRHVVIIMYGSKITKEEIKNIALHAEAFKILPENKEKKFYMISRSEYSEHGLTLTDFDVKPHDIDIEQNYNDDFKEVHTLINDSLNEKKKNGLILLHGKYGTGKTYYIRHLVCSIDKKFIYLPLHMIDSLSAPNFLPFMTENSDSVLILEDCETILMPRSDGNPNVTALSNLLNLGDGLLADALSINVICTFNSDLKKIDDAILRKGRLIARYEFKELETAKAQKLADKLNKGCTIEKPSTLADIYNIDAKSFSNTDDRKKIGFGQ